MIEVAEHLSLAQQQGHWTRQEIMFLFHEVFPQNRTMDWQRVARIVGREAADCEARMPVLINDLETSISKLPLHDLFCLALVPLTDTHIVHIADKYPSI